MDCVIAVIVAVIIVVGSALIMGRRVEDESDELEQILQDAERTEDDS